MGLGGSKPAPVAYSEPPQGNDPAVEAALAKEKLLAKKKKGRAATIMSDQTPEPAAVSGQKTLLGE